MKKLTLLGLAMLASSTLASCNAQPSTTKLKIGMECNYQPFNWTEVSANEYTLPIANQAGKYADGYDIQLSKIISQELNKEVEIYAIEWDSLITDLNAGTIDCVIAGMTDTAERRKEIAFTDEYYHSELVLVTSKTVADQYEGQTLTSDDLTTLLNNQVMVSQISTVTYNVIDTFVSDYNAIKANALPTFADCAVDVKNGTAFAMTAELPVAESIAQSNSTLGIVHIAQNILGEAGADLGVSIGVRQADTTLKDQLNTALAKISNSKRKELMDAATQRAK